MKLNTYPAPHIRYHETSRTVMGDAVLALLILYAMAFFYFGVRALALGAWSVGICILVDIFCLKLGKRPVNFRDLSPIVTGLILPLLMPATVPYTVVAVAAVVAIAVAKHPFGGVGHNVFNPAAAGFSFVAISYGAEVFNYPLPLQRLGVLLTRTAEGAVLTPAADGAMTQIVFGASPAFTMELGGIPKYELVDMALGKFPGPMGATNILVILACLLYLVLKNTVRWETPVTFLAVMWLFAFLFPTVDKMLLPELAHTFGSRVEFATYELMSGLLLFGGVFLMGDPVTTPKRTMSKVLFGVVSGIMAMLFRRFGRMEEGLTFAILLMNGAVWGFDMVGERIYSKLRRRELEVLNGKALQKKA